MKLTARLSIGLFALLVTGRAVGAMLPDQHCLTARVAAVGRLAVCELRARSTAILRGTTPDVAACVDALSSRWAAIDAKYQCHVAVGSPVVADKVDQFVQDMMALLSPPPPKIIFTTLEIVAPGDNLSLGFFYYPSRGDEICNRVASHSSLLTNKHFVAAVCGREPDVANGDMQGIRQRSTDSPGGYVRTDGARIADNLSDLLDGAIQVPISHDQFGDLLPDVESGDVIPVWTGCTVAGDPLTIDRQCSYGSGWSWTTNASIVFAEIGRPDRSDASWFDHGFDSCIVGRHLYCIEQ